LVVLDKKVCSKVLIDAVVAPGVGGHLASIAPASVVNAAEREVPNTPG
jgi:hypothetical protein